MVVHVFVLLVGSVLMSVPANGRSESIPERGVDRLIDSGYQKGGPYGISASRPRTVSKDSYPDSTQYNRYGSDKGPNRISYKYIDDDQPYGAKSYCEGDSNAPVKRPRNPDYVGEKAGPGGRIPRPYDIAAVPKYINRNVKPIRMKIDHPYRYGKYGAMGRGRYYGYDRLLPNPANAIVERNDGLLENDAGGTRTYSEKPLAAAPGYPEIESPDDKSGDENSALSPDSTNLNTNMNIVRNRRRINENDRFSIADQGGKIPSDKETDSDDEMEMEKYNDELIS